jgi:adenylate cyclase
VALANEEIRRRLTAILAADVVGYSQLMGSDEARTVRDLKGHQGVLLPLVAEFAGRVMDIAGDGIVAEFASAVKAVECAVAIQRTMAERNSDVDPARRMQFRIGVNIGDVIYDETRIYGDGVNVAARLEGIAEPGGIYVSEDTYRQARDKVDVPFAYVGEQSLKNIARPVRTYRLVLDGSSAPGAPELPLPSKPSIAVLAFQNMTGDPGQEYFADGIAEDIITMLSRSQLLFVIARNSSFTYKNRSIDVKQTARELGVRYVLEGSVRRGGNRVRITGQLIDGITGNHMWAERYDRDLADVFAVQDEITEAVAIAIEPAVAEMERRRAVRKPPESLDAWEAYQRGLWHMGRIGASDNEAARSFFQRAIDLDPNFASPLAQLAIAMYYAASTYQLISITEALEQGPRLARKAIALDPSSAAGYVGMSLAQSWQGDHENGIAAARQALGISPNYAGAHHALGRALLFSARPQEALDAIRKAIRLDPYDPVQPLRSLSIAIAHYFLREYEPAVDAAKQVLRVYPDHPLAYRWLAAALGQIGRVDEAKEALKKAIVSAPKSFDIYVRQRVPWHRAEDHAHMLEGLRKAGWEG